MDEIFAVYGASGCGRSLMPMARNVAKKEILFIDDSLESNIIVNNHITITYEKFKIIKCSKYVVIAIANSKIRERIANRLLSDNIILWSIKDKSTIIMDNVILGEGAALSPFVTIGSNVSIGRCFHANLYSYVEHDCVIGDYVTFAPRVSCNGNVHIHNHAYIGTGAVIKQGTPDKPLVIGEGAVVGMGAVVTKDIPAGAVVVGNPARILK